MAIKGTIYGINGPIILVRGNLGYQMNEMVYVGESRLIGEVIGLTSRETTIQVYEDTSGLKPKEPVEGTGGPICVTLHGHSSNIFDGIERPLETIAKTSGAFIPTGACVDALDRERLWETHLTVAVGDAVSGGSIIAEVRETASIVHKVMLAPDISGEVVFAQPDGAYPIVQELVRIRTGEERKQVSA